MHPLSAGWPRPRGRRRATLARGHSQIHCFKRLPAGSPQSPMAGTQSLGAGHVRRREGGSASAAADERRGTTEKGAAAPDGRLTSESVSKFLIQVLGVTLTRHPLNCRHDGALRYSSLCCLMHADIFVVVKLLACCIRTGSRAIELNQIGDCLRCERQRALV